MSSLPGGDLRTVEIDGRRLSYRLQRKRVKNINLRIHSDGCVFVSAASRVPESTIDAFVRSKAPWIRKILERQAEAMAQRPGTLQYTEGERIPYLGGSLVLHVCPASRTQAALEDGRLVLRVRNTADFELRSKTVEAWRRERVTEIVTALCWEFYPCIADRGVAFPVLRFRRMVSRWGSCNPRKGVLTFSTALLGAPWASIEYVVVHEFVHFLQANHSAAFYGELTRFLPDWKVRKKGLCSVAPSAF